MSVTTERGTGGPNGTEVISSPTDAVGGRKYGRTISPYFCPPSPSQGDSAGVPGLSRSLDAEQRRFLTLFPGSNPERLRAAWLDGEGRNLGAVVDPMTPPAAAVRLKVWRLVGDDGRTYRGALEACRLLAVFKLPALAALWADPLRTLNAEGLSIAAESVEPTLRQSFKIAGRAAPLTYRQTPADFAWLKAEAARSGVTMTDVINEALALYRASSAEGEA